MTSAPAIDEVADPPAEEPRRGVFQALARPPGIGFHLVVAVPVVASLFAASSPAGTEWLLDMLALLLVPILVVVWAARLLGWLLAWRRGRGAHGGWRFAVAPAMGALTLVLLATGAPLTVRWGLSRGAFDREVARLHARPAPGRPATPRSLGLYHVDQIDQQGRDVVFSVGSEFLDESGFVYAPDGADAGRRVVGRTGGVVGWSPLGHGWYAFSVSL